MPDNNFEIEIKAPFGGFAPAWYKNTYPFIGNSNHFSDLVSIDLRDPNVFKQGATSTALTNGTQAGVVSTLIKGISKIASASNVAYAIGGAKLYKLNATTVASGGSPSWPRTIDKAVVTGEDGESVANFQGALYYFYNHSGGAGDVGKYNLASAFDDDWGSVVPTGHADLQNAPHPSIVGADYLMFGNGKYVGRYDGTTFAPDKLDFKASSVVADIEYTNGWFYVAVNYPNVSGDNANEATIYIWDGNSASWETAIKFKGRIGALLVDNGIVYVWYEEEDAAGGYKLGYISGNTVVELETYDGGMPAFYQKLKYTGFLTWVSDDRIYMWGTAIRDKLTPTLFDFCSAGYATVGGISAPFGTLMMASNATTNYKIVKIGNYAVTSSLHSLMFDVSKSGNISMIDEVITEHYKLATGARVDASILTNFDITTTALGTISYTLDGASAIRKSFYPKVECDNFRLKYDFANGSASNPVQIRKIIIKGHFQQG